jgi:photosystem II stability/assembly factor-like uncharacterized protein
MPAIATSLNHPETAYVSYSARGGSLGFGVARSSDLGKTWQFVWQARGQETPANMHDPWMAARFGLGWCGAPSELAVAPNDPNVCYGVTSGSVVKTTDGGKGWYGLYARQVEGGGTTTSGLDVTTNYGVHFDPFDRKHLFISYTDIGLFASEDGGKSWSSATRTAPRPWVNTTYWMEFDPEVKGRTWAVMSGTHDLPRPKMWRGSGSVRQTGGVAISDDGGRTWKQAEGLPQIAATHILLDPKSPKDARTLYVAGFGRGVFKSTDGGKTWTLKNSGIAGKDPLAWRFARAGDGTLYVIIARRSENGTFGDAGDGAIYRSRDGAESWERIPLPEKVNGPNGLSVDPADPKRLYLAAWGRDMKDVAVDGGIFISSDAGATWKKALDRDQHVYDVTVDPRNPRTLYACGFEDSAWRSRDRGATWERIRGYNFKWGHRVVPDPYNPKMIYVTTYGGSVWYGPADGDPKAAEDIVTPVVGFAKK